MVSTVVVERNLREPEITSHYRNGGKLDPGKVKQNSSVHQ